MSRLCVIPARGGSKRIPRKNIRSFLGRPVIAYSIAAARESGLFSEVMVSTEDAEIAAVAREHGASVPFLRSAENANDHAGTADVLREVHRRHPGAFAEACCLYATAPFVTPTLLRRAHARFVKEGWETLFPVLRFGFPVQRALRMGADGGVSMLYPEHRATRSQDLEPAYHDCGMFYWYRPAQIVAGGSLYPPSCGGLLVSELEAHDIDTEEDWRVAELKFKMAAADG